MREVFRRRLSLNRPEVFGDRFSAHDRAFSAGLSNYTPSRASPGAAILVPFPLVERSSEADISRMTLSRIAMDVGVRVPFVKSGRP